MVEIQKTLESDAKPLRSAAVSAFLDDGRYKPASAQPGGPPGHDIIAKHRKWIREHDYFTCFVYGNIAGGCIVKRHSYHCELFGIFLHSDFIGQGIGSRFLGGVMKLYPAGSLWVLETPDYAERNQRFYERNGFRVNSKSKPAPGLGYGFIRYQKIALQRAGLEEL